MDKLYDAVKTIKKYCESREDCEGCRLKNALYCEYINGKPDEIECMPPYEWTPYNVEDEEDYYE